MSEIDELQKTAVVDDLRKQVVELTMELAAARQLIQILRRSLENKNAPSTETTVREGATPEEQRNE